jgi:amino acid adenylation domain-containing protein
MSLGLLQPVVDVLTRSPRATAIWDAEDSVTYHELGETASKIAAALPSSGSAPFAAVLAERGTPAYLAFVGALWSGRGFCPLDPSFPPARNLDMLERSDADVLIADPLHLDAAKVLAAGCTRTVEVVSTGDLPASGIDPRPARDVAYLQFTSGSTGQPKGVAITHANALYYVRYITSRYGFGPSDRCSQAWPLTSDASVHDVFCTFAAGASLVPFTRTHLMQPGSRINQARVTVWFSVPSVAMVMRRLRALKPGALPSLRLSLFCGEALPVATARAWAEAAPGGPVVNLYGPTEATVAFTEHEFDPAQPDEVFRAGTVPIGRPFEGLQVIVDESGELLLGGPQVAPGYWHAPDVTAQRFVAVPGLAGRWYRTGDIVERDDDGVLHFLGRVDDQLKIHGHRIEVQEVDTALREAVGHDLALAVPYPVTEEGVQGLVACIEEAEPRPAAHEAVLEHCRRILAPYMVPTRVVSIAQMPLNANGKLDRSACVPLIEAAG